MLFMNLPIKFDYHRLTEDSLMLLFGAPLAQLLASSRTKPLQQQEIIFPFPMQLANCHIGF